MRPSPKLYCSKICSTGFFSPSPHSQKIKNMLSPHTDQDDDSISELDLDFNLRHSSLPASSRVPPEIWRQILRSAFLSRFQPVILAGQFADIEACCQLCTLLSIALVSHVWWEIARELALEDIVVRRTSIFLFWLKSLKRMWGEG